MRLNYQIALNEFEKTNGEGLPPVRPVAGKYPCADCNGTGLISSAGRPVTDIQTYPRVAIIGGGIGGVALAVALLHRGIPFTLYEWDRSFNDRSQGYGLTLQQGSKAVAGLGIASLAEGVISTRHVVHTPEGKIVGEWGMRKWLHQDAETFTKRTNVHIARQSLRLAMLEQLGGNDAVQWGHQLLDFKEGEDGRVDLRFEVDGVEKHATADLVVGADGIRSVVRKLLVGEAVSPLRYLHCIVILGICPLAALAGIESDLLDSATVFQTANGNERIYMMPYSADAIMWQLSFPMPEEEARALSALGAAALLEEARRQTNNWHNPVSQILAATLEAQVSGYPVYDREPLEAQLPEQWGPVTLIGDAAHPMSPFKGQGANQALLDAVALAREITKGCRSQSDWRTAGIRESVLKAFEAEMFHRSASKVEDSAAAAQFLHSKIVLHESNQPRGRCVKR